MQINGMINQQLEEQDLINEDLENQEGKKF